MCARIATGALALFASVFLGQTIAAAQPALPSTYQGYIHWSAFGEAPQEVVLVLDAPKTEGGVITATGRELYFTATRFHEVKINVRIVTAERRFELYHLPDPTNFTDGSCVPDVLVGTIAPDFSSIAGPLVTDDDSPAIPDFSFATVRRFAAR